MADERDERLGKIIAEFLQAAERGETVDGDAIVAAHPELADDLRSFFANHERMRKVHAAEIDPTVVPTLPPRPHELTDPVAIEPTIAVTTGTSPATAVGDHVRYFGDYELLEEIARGGMGVIYKARQVNLKRVVALKMILAGQLAGETEVRRFRAEAEAAAKLDHPNIVPIFEVGEHNGQHYFSMGYVQGRSLADRIAAGPLPPDDAASLVKTLAEAIQYAHGKGVIHRDLKPANVLLEKKDEATVIPKITDFGLAKRIEDDSGLTAAGQILGTPAYMPPEQAAGKLGEVTVTADVYSLGAILYCLLVGRPPFQAANPMDTLLQVIDQEPVSPRQLNRGVPVDLETICLKCLRKEPRARYASALDLAEDLRRFQVGEPISARPVGRVERIVKWVKRRPLVAGLLAAVFVVALTGVAAFAWAFGETVKARNDAMARQVETSKALKQTEKARQETADALKDTENARRKTADALADAERERREKEKELLRAESLIYCMQTNKAHELLLSGDLVGCRQTLDECRGDLRGPAYGYLARQVAQRVRTLFSHTNSVSSLALSSDGKRLCSGSHDHTIKVWDLEAGKETTTLRGHTDSVTSLALSADGKRLYSGSQDRTIKVWDLEAGKETIALSGHKAGVLSLLLSADGKRLFSGSGDLENKLADPGEIKVWDLEAGEEALTLRGHTDRVASLALSADGKRLYSGSNDQTIKVWDLETGQEMRTLRGHSYGVSSLALTADGKWLFSAGDDIKVWDLEASKEALTLRGHTLLITSLALSADGKRLYSGSDVLKVWNLEKWWAGGPEPPQAVLTLRGHSSGVSSLALSADGQRLFSGSGGFPEFSVKLWDLEAGDEDRTLRGHTSGVSSLASAADGTRLCSGSYDKTIKVWDLVADKVILTLRGSSASPLALSADGQRLCSGSDSHIKVWDLETGKGPLTLRGHMNSVTSLTLSADGKRLYSGSHDRTIKVWDLETGKAILTLRGIRSGTNPVLSLALSADGKRLYSGSGFPEFSIKAWDLEAGKEALTLRGHSSNITSLALSADGKRLYSASGELGKPQGIKVWDLDAVEETLTLHGHTHGVTSLALSPDGKRLFSASADQTIKVWELEAGKECLTLRAAGVISLALSADGKRLYSGSEGSTIKVWDFEAGKEGLTRHSGAEAKSAQRRRSERFRK